MNIHRFCAFVSGVSWCRLIIPCRTLLQRLESVKSEVIDRVNDKAQNVPLSFMTLWLDGQGNNVYFPKRTSRTIKISAVPDFEQEPNAQRASPSEKAIGVVPRGGPGEVKAVKPASGGRVLDRLQAHIGQPQFAGAVEPDLELGPCGCGVPGLKDKRIRLPLRAGREVFVVEQGCPVGCVLDSPIDFPCCQALGPGSQRHPIPLSTPDGQFVLGDHDFRRLGSGLDARHGDDLGPTAVGAWQRFPAANGAVAVWTKLPLIGNAVARAIGAEVAIPDDRLPARTRPAGR